MHLVRIIAGVLLCSLAFAQQAAEVAAKASPSVVLIKGVTADAEVMGSGFLISSDGKIVTNLHVIRELRTAGVQLSSGEIFDTFTILAFDERKDLVIIRVPAFDAPAMELGNSNQVTVGEPVIAVGSPRGLTGTVTAGILSAVRDHPFIGGVKVLQTDAAVNGGNSGGPLLNNKAQAIGVIVAKFKGAEGLNFAIPINYVRGMLADVGVPIDLQTLRSKLQTTTDVFETKTATPAAIATRWKSLQSGTVRSVRVTADHVYAEIVPPLPKGLQFQMYDLRKQGDVFSGKRRERFVCEYVATWPRQSVQNTCALEYETEISMITSERIEGRTQGGEKGNNFDCRKCTYAKPLTHWNSFVWIPE